MRIPKSFPLCAVFAMGLVAPRALAQQPANAANAANATAGHPPLSALDMASARDLYYQGVQLQQAGKYADALDKFQRAQQIFEAPTQLLHIAECQAAMDKLVEASETYRALGHVPLDAKAPDAFKAAKAEGAAELAQIEPRIPFLKVDVVPAGITGLHLAIDDQPVNVALVGVSRPLNPGAHKLVVHAKGFHKEEQTFALKEKESRSFTVTLRPVAPPADGVAVTPVMASGSAANAEGPITPAPPAYGAAAPATATAPQVTYAPSEPPPPPVYDAGEMERRRGSTKSLLLGGRIGANVPSGSVVNGSDFSSFAGTGGALALEAGLRFAKRWYVGLDVEGTIYSAPTGTSPDFLTPAANQNRTTTSSGALYAVHVGFLTNPYGTVGFYGDLGLGYRTFSTVNRFSLKSDSSSYYEESYKLSGGDLLVTIGLKIRATDAFWLIPKAQLGLGSFGDLSATCTAGGSGVCNTGAASASLTAQDQGTHAILFLGVGGYYNLNLP